MALTTWSARHAVIAETLDNDSVKAALQDFWATKYEQQTWASCPLATRLDIAQVVAWSSQGLSVNKDPNALRASAHTAMHTITDASLQIRDFKSVKILQKSAGSLVEVVQARLNGQIYVLKSLVKGFARRNAAIQTPSNEAKLLQRRDLDAAVSPLLTPQLLAAFQTQNSVHLLMEFVPSGDFSELLMAASSCGPDYPGRASTGLLTENWIFAYSVDMVQAISWVHSQGFAHRDVKPGNFLLDNTGHLKLCDFSSAAPFSDYQLPDPAHPTKLSTSRKVWSFYCSQPTGTCDYLSPEVLEAEETRVLERQQRYLSMSCDDILSAHFNLNDAAPDPSASDAATPGPYGPELDWWSFGIILYEMRFGVLPFFADKMEHTYERIKNHHDTLKLDASVECSANLTLLIQQLLTTAAQRLGRTSSQQVKDHAFYSSQKVDWAQQWPVQPPFTPKSHATPSASSSPAHAAAAYTDGAGQYSLSVMSSVPSFSALYTGNADDFPLFEDSREFQPDEESPSKDLPVSSNECSLPRSSSSPAVVEQSTTLSPLRSSTLSPALQRSSDVAVTTASRWSDCDAAFVGFSYLPAADAFAPTTTAIEPKRRSGELSTAPSFADLALESPSGWPTSTPAASTPFTRNGVSAHSYPTPPSFAASPAGQEAPTTIEASARLGGARLLSQQTFVTPARKPSYMAMHDRFRQDHHQAAIPEEQPPHYTPAAPTVPQSPYPFPVASVSRVGRMTDNGKKSVLKRPHLERAHSSATPGGGSVGSDSRQSGGSNAVREISEREAWDEMMAAVQKSVRKKQKDFGAPSPLASVHNSAGISRSSTDPRFSLTEAAASKIEPKAPQQHGKNNDVGRNHASSIAPMPAGANEQAMRQMPTTKLVAPRPIVMLPASPYHSESEEDSLPGSPNHLFVPSHHAALDIDMYDSDDSLELHPAQAGGGGGGRRHHHRQGLNHKKSARQLLIRAQERGTPTKPKRTPSPSLTETNGANSAGGGGSPTSSSSAGLTGGIRSRYPAIRTRSSSPMLLSDHANNSLHSLLSSRDTSYDNKMSSSLSRGTRLAHTCGGGGEGNVDLCSPNTSTEVLSGSLGKTSITFAPMSYGSASSVLGAIAPLRDANGRTSSSNGGAGELSNGPGRKALLRRKDSGEMLSQYRKGMGRATSMMSLSAQAKADATAAAVAIGGSTGSDASISPPIDDDFILGNVENRVRAGGVSSVSHRTLRRFSSALPGSGGKDRSKAAAAAAARGELHTDQQRPSSQDGTAARSIKGFGRFRSRMTTSLILNEEEDSPEAAAKPTNKTQQKSQHHQQHTTAQTEPAAEALVQAVELKATQPPVPPRLQVTKSQYRLRDHFPRSFGVYRSSDSAHVSPPVSIADVSLMTGLNQRNTVLQGSLFGLEQRLARLKARLED